MGLKICSLASGSKGNCCYVSDGRTDVLIDLGISATRAETCMRILGASAENVSVLITHSHSDHVGGLKVFCKKHGGVSLYCQAESAYAVAHAAGVQPNTVGRRFSVGTLDVTALPVSHDVACFGYIIQSDGKKVAVVTDVGTLDANQLSALSDCDIVMLESNHDLDRLHANPNYSQMLKARIASRRGHLSNADCAAACAFLAIGGVRNFILAHLSEENNDKELALAQVKKSIIDAGVLDARVVAATQDAMTGLFEVC